MTSRDPERLTIGCPYRTQKDYPQQGAKVKKILVYSHDTFGLGNIRRMLEISKHLVSHDPDVSVLVISGSPMLHAFRIPHRVDYIKLPCLRRTLRGGYDVKYLDLDYDDLIRLRANIILSAVLDFAPDLILVDKKPFGVGNELAPAFQLVQRRTQRPKLVLLLRDILDSAEATIPVWQKNGYFEAIESFYDEVLVVGSKNVFNLAHEYRFPPATQAKVRFCGYLRRERGLVGREELRRQLKVVDGEQLALVTVGGGEDGYRLVDSFLAGLVAKPAGFKSLVICGPEMREEDRVRVLKAASSLPNLLIKDFTDDMMSYMEAADLVVSMAGYNTTCELLSLRKRAVLVPRVQPVQEQWIRAERLASLGLFRAIHPQDLTPHLLRTAIEEELARGNVHVHKLYNVDLEGLPSIAKAIDALLGRSSVSRENHHTQQWALN
jgi:predicted glycosyltransferase